MRSLWSSIPYSSLHYFSLRVTQSSVLKPDIDTYYMVYITNGIELCVLFCITFVRFAHIVECGSVPVLLESTSLCDCTTLYISTLLKMTLGCFYFGAITSRLPGILLSLPDVFLKPGAGLPSLQEECPLQWFTALCLASLYPLPLTWDAWHGFFSWIQVDSVWGHDDVFGDAGRAPEELRNRLGVMVLTSCYNLEMLVPVALSHAPCSCHPLPDSMAAESALPRAGFSRVRLTCKRGSQVPRLKLLWNFLCSFDLFSWSCQALISSKPQLPKLENICFFLSF